MRTAVTIGVTHAGKEVLIAGRKVPIHEQKQSFQALLGTKEHAEFSEINYQETDDGHGYLRKIAFTKSPTKAPVAK